MSDADDAEALDELSLAAEGADELDDSFEGEEAAAPDSLELAEDDPLALDPFADELEARESVMYHPLPLNTMPTG